MRSNFFWYQLHGFQNLPTKKLVLVNFQIERYISAKMSRCGRNRVGRRSGGNGSSLSSSLDIPHFHPFLRRATCACSRAAERCRCPTGWRNGSRAQGWATSSQTSTASTRSSSLACRSDDVRPSAAPLRAAARIPRGRARRFRL